MKLRILTILILTIIFACQEKSVEPHIQIAKVEPIKFLPFQQIDLDDLSDFNEVSDNWKLVGDAYVDRSKDKTISATEGSGVLINQPTEGSRQNLFTNFDHGDIELEIDVMLPVKSNSGLYFQGRYEVQLFDSWGKTEPKHSDLGGIYQRWDTLRVKGKEGFEGAAPKMNAAKSPGLWQHFNIIFHAPRFDAAGKKIKNASFEEVWLNGVLIHEDIVLSGPTRAAAFDDEKSRAPLMIQGDHGPVAFKNMKYKMYGDEKVTLSELTMTAYENKEVRLPDFDSIASISTIKTDSISANMVGRDRAQRILKFDGAMNIPRAGDYLFDLKVNEAGGLLVVDSDTVIDMNGDFNLDSLGLGKVSLQEGAVPFTMIYNKHRPWTKGFSLEVEGPGIQKHALQAPNSLDLSRGKPDENIMVEVGAGPIAQRSFLMHNGVKRTHCISVGTIEKINYAYDLASGSLLKAWSGDFLNATPMWHGRGQKQLGIPAGFTISFHGQPEFAELENGRSDWPKSHEDGPRKQMGYEFDQDRIPVFSYRLGNTLIADKLMPSKTLRIVHRLIEVNAEQEIWHKIADGESILKLEDGTYIVNNESYFIDFSGSGKLNPTVRKSLGRDELLLKIPKGEQIIEYSIIW